MSLRIKIIVRVLGYLIVSANTIGANHLTPTSNIVLGKKIYNDHCKACHGDRGDGKTFAANVLLPPPQNFIAKTTKAKLTREQMIRSVTKGRSNTAMMPWENVLNEREIHSVVDYIRKELMGLKE
jgi:mono/diheme cytochrome c family protein